MIRIKKILPSILLLFLSVALGLLIIEIVSRHLGKPYFEENKVYILTDYSIFLPKPNYEYTIARAEYKSNIKFNSKGLRDYEIEYSKLNGTKRIALLGDSFIVGYELPLNKTISKVLEKKLNENNKNAKYEAINMGLRGFGTTGEAVFLEKDGIKYNPDIVVLNLFVGNDITKIDFGVSGSIPKEVFENNDDLENISLPVTKIQKLKHFIFRNYFTYSYVNKLMNDIKNKGIDAGYYNDIAETINKEWTANTEEKLEKAEVILRHLKRYTEKKGIKLLVVLVPAREQVDERKLSELVEKFGFGKSQMDIQKAQRILLQFGKESNIPMLDLLLEFRKRNMNNSFYFETDGHWNEKGNQLAAQLIFEELKKEEFITS